MKHRPPRNFDRSASEADRAYQLAREEEVMLDAKRQKEIAEILNGRRPGIPWQVWLVVGVWAICMGVMAWGIARWLS